MGCLDDPDAGRLKTTLKFSVPINREKVAFSLRSLLLTDYTIYSLPMAVVKPG
jgi:hypothetical protein